MYYNGIKITEMADFVVKSIKILILVLVIIVSVGGCAAPEDTTVLPGYIMHAGGEMPDGQRGTNSIEAMNLSYDSGEYWLELDFCPTSDSHFVCLHDFNACYSKIITGVEVPDFETFESLRKSTYNYESPTLDSLITWLDGHPKAVIVTDVKENNLEFARQLAESYPNYIERFALQIYGRDEYDAAVALGFDKIIYTLYKQPFERYDTELMREFVESSEKLIALTYAADVENSESIAEIAELGVPVYIHTINTAQEQSYWQKLGVYGFYTDCVVPDEP